MNRFETELKARRGIINGRKWRCDRYGGANRMVISEVRASRDGQSELVYRDQWGQPNIGFRTLELAGCDRRHAMTFPAYRDDKISQFKRAAREGIERSRYMRLTAEEASCRAVAEFCREMEAA